MADDMEKLGASFLADEGYEVQRTNNFEIQIEMKGLSNNATGKKRYLMLAVVSGFLPNETNEVISLNYGNSTVTVAGKANVNNNGSIVVRDLIEKDVESIIDEWRSTVYNKETEKIGFAADYKTQATLTQSAPDGTILRKWTLKGVWPSGVDYGQISYDSPGVKTINMTLQYDKAVLDTTRYTSAGAETTTN